MKGRLYKMKQKHLTLEEREFIEEKLNKHRKTSIEPLFLKKF